MKYNYKFALAYFKEDDGGIYSTIDPCVCCNKDVLNIYQTLIGNLCYSCILDKEQTDPDFALGLGVENERTSISN